MVLISFLNLIFSYNSFALFTPTLSASVDQVSLQVNGNQVINSTDKTTEIPFNFTVNTNIRTGYTATLNAETENTALTNASSASGAKIDSISMDLTLNNLPNNTWGYKFGTSANYSPIPALSTPSQILKTTEKTNGNESSQLSIGMKLSNNLESGRYQNKLILSFTSNPYQMRAVMTDGVDFNAKLKSLETTTNKIEHFKKSTLAPVTTNNALNIEDYDSDYEIKLWLNPEDKTAYYYTQSEKVYLNRNCLNMFYRFYNDERLINLSSIDLTGFDTTYVESMTSMFYGAQHVTALNVSNFDTSNVTTMNNMFYDMSSIGSLNLSNFNTSNVTNMNAMFYGMVKLTHLDISNFDTSNVTNMEWMFGAYVTSPSEENLQRIYVGKDFDVDKLLNYQNIFKNRKKLRGGNGSYLSDPSTADKSWLRIDDPTHGRPGYFTRKP